MRSGTVSQSRVVHDSLGMPRASSGRSNDGDAKRVELRGFHNSVWRRRWHKRSWQNERSSCRDPCAMSTPLAETDTARDFNFRRRSSTHPAESFRLFTDQETKQSSSARHAISHRICHRARTRMQFALIASRLHHDSCLQIWRYYEWQQTSLVKLGTWVSELS